MPFKNYIALLFIVIFLGKLVTMDAKFFGAFLDSSGVTFVNKMCSKKLLQNVSPPDDISTATVNQNLEMNFVCHTVFDYPFTEWVAALTEDNFRKFIDYAPGLISTHRKKFYPPPKVWFPSV